MLQEGERPPILSGNDQMVNHYIAPFIGNELVVDAFRKVDRRDFVFPGQEHLAYKEEVLMIAEGESSISSPIVQAILLDELDLTGSERVLEIGTASGYSAAVLSQCVGEVITVEFNRELAEQAQERLVRGGYSNVTCVVGDGAQGYEERALYDRIVVTAGAREMPLRLIDQLAPEGRIVVPIGNRPLQQDLIVARKAGNSFTVESVHEGYCFVPLISTESGGWSPEEIERQRRIKEDANERTPAVISNGSVTIMSQQEVKNLLYPMK